MLKYKCPYCGKRVITFKDKIKTTSAKGIYCAECKGKLRIPFIWHIIWVFLVGTACSLTAIYIKWHIHAILVKIFLLILCVCFFCFIGLLFSPLIKEKENRE